jgi:preprotein translocase subunit SecE
MATKIYKQGQGYWTRLVSGVAGAVLTLAFCFWLWEKTPVWFNYPSLQSSILWIQAAIVLPIMLVAGLLIWKFTAVKPATCDFLIDTEGEMRKVNWPARREVFGATWVVILVMFGMVVLLGVADWVFAVFFRYIGILESA